MTILKGYVTYIAAAGILLLAGASFLQGDTNGAVRHFTEALALFGLRRAIG